MLTKTNSIEKFADGWDMNSDDYLKIKAYQLRTGLLHPFSEMQLQILPRVVFDDCYYSECELDTKNVVVKLYRYPGIKGFLHRFRFWKKDLPRAQLLSRLMAEWIPYNKDGSKPLITIAWTDDERRGSA